MVASTLLVGQVLGEQLGAGVRRTAAHVVLLGQVAFEKWGDEAKHTARILAAIFAGLAILGLIFHWLNLDEPPPPNIPTVTTPAASVIPVRRCEEDQPCWNCSTMGNLICGGR